MKETHTLLADEKFKEMYEHYLTSPENCNCIICKVLFTGYILPICAIYWQWKESP